MKKLRFYVIMSVLTSLAILLGVAFCVATQPLAQKFAMEPERLQNLGIRLLIVGGIFKVGVIFLGAWRLSRLPNAQSKARLSITKEPD